MDAELSAWCALSTTNYIQACLLEASYGLRVLSSPASVCVCMCVCVSVNHQFVRTITCHLLKLQLPKLDQKWKTPWLRSVLFLGFIDLDLQGQIELQSQNLPHFELVSFPRDKSIPNEVRLSKFGPKMRLSTVKVPIDFGVYWSSSSVSFLTSNLLYSTKFYVSYSFASFCIYLVRPWPVSVPHPTWLRTHTDSYACRQGPAIDREKVKFYILVRSLHFSQSQLGNWHCILQAVIGFCLIIYTSHVEILYTNIRQSPKQQ